MVNCKNCGAPLNLNDAYCPHCGTPNPEAQEHLHKLIQLDKKVDEAAKEVKEEVKKSKKGYGLLIALTMLLLATLVVLVSLGASYEIADRIITSRMSETQIKATLDDLLDRGEYIELDVFMDKYYLPYDDYYEYTVVGYLADYYSRMVDHMSEYLYAVDPYDDPLVKVCQNTIDFKLGYERDIKRDLTEKTKAHLRALNAEVDAFLKYYLHLTDEEISGIKDMNNSSLVVLVSGRLENEK